MSHKHIIYGPNDESDVPKESMGKYFLECLRRRDREDIFNIDAFTKDIRTCGQLLQDSIKLTTVLKSMSIEKDDVITIISKNNIDYFVPILAGLYMGVILNPLNPDYTKEELMQILYATQTKVIFCSESALPVALALKEQLECIREVISMSCKASQEETMDNLLNSVEMDTETFEPEVFDYAEQGAFILASSGTTGLPKGVLLTHQNLRQSVVVMGYPGSGAITSRDVTVQYLPCFHIFGIVVQVAALTRGMKAVLMSSFEPHVFLQCIEEYRATTLHTVPAILNFLSKSALIDEYNLSSVQQITVAAGPIGQQDLEEASKKLPNANVRRGYGMTETTGGCLYQAPADATVGTVGTLVPGMAGKVWDYKLNKAVGPMELGELCFKGPLVMKYYLGKEEETRESIDSDGFLHSGDIGYYDENDNFFIVDRLKDMIKYKGFQVSPVELENLIMTHPKVQDCGVVGIPNEKSGELPCAFVVHKQGSIVSEGEIIDFVAERISVQKHLHGGVRFVEEIPRTASGKLLRRALLNHFKGLY